MEQEKLPKFTFWLMILLAASIIVNIIQYNASKPDPKAQQKATEYENQAATKKAEADTLKARIDTTTTAHLTRSAKHASKAITIKTKAHENHFIPSTDTSFVNAARKVANYPQ